MINKANICPRNDLLFNQWLIRCYCLQLCGCWATNVSQSVLSLFTLALILTFRKIHFENNAKPICMCSFRVFIGVMLVIMSQLKHQFDLCSIVPSTSQQSSGLLHYVLSSIESRFIPNMPRPNCCYTAWLSWNHTVTIKSCRLIENPSPCINLCISLCIFILIGIWKIGRIYLSMNSGAFTICAAHSQWAGCHKKDADEDVVSILQYWPAVHIFSSVLLWIIIGCGAFLCL